MYRQRLGQDWNRLGAAQTILSAYNMWTVSGGDAPAVRTVERPSLKA